MARATITGVERWAAEVIPRLLALSPNRYRVALPPRGFANRAGQVWEQLVLPARAARIRASVIWSPANLAPLLWPRNVVVLHDAAVLRNANDYSPVYRAWHGHFGILCARRALRVVTVSEFSRHELIELGGLDPERVVVIPGAVDARFHASADAERVMRRYQLNRPYVLTVATDDTRKNLSVLNAAAWPLRDAGLELVWAGAARRHIVASDSTNGMRRLGYVADEDLPGLYAGARAFVLPSRYEGFGLTCLEAMACGTPVVAANRAALPETCAGAALLVNPDHPAEVTAAILRAVSEEPLRSRLREDGLQRAARATWDQTAQEIDALLIGLSEGLTLRVAVVVLHFNGREDTLACLQSVAQSDWSSITTVIVDNASEVDIRGEVRDRFPDAVLVRNERNLGFAGGMNVGLGCALELGADYVLLLNNDTVVDQAMVRRLVEACNARPDAGIVSPLVLARGTSDQVLSAGWDFDPRRGHPGRPVLAGARRTALVGIREVVAASGEAMLVSAAVVQQVGPLDEALYLRLEDIDWSLRMRARGRRNYVVLDAILWHAVSASSGGDHSALSAYYHTRNILTVCARHAPLSATGGLVREAEVLIANLAHTRRGSNPARNGRAVLSGWRDYRRGRLGAR